MKKEDEPQIDESLLTEEQKEEMKYSHFSWPSAIFFLVLLGLILICVLVVVLIPA
ncbi:MAG: hypothetical protein SPG64_03980 [Candidatus Enteromonas sp.]|nr:hypothetical protein [Candidatus Enteromonas sp.]